MDRAKILDKIKKCLALSKSPNEHEAAAALRQAQKLMDKHGVTAADLGAVGYGSERVDTTIQRGQGRRNKKTGETKPAPVPTTLAVIINLMHDAFGVMPIVNSDYRETDLNWYVVYYGPEDRVLLAAYAHTVVARAVEKAWQRFLKEHPEYKGAQGGRAGFYIGWIRAVRDQIHEFAMTEEEKASTQLVIQRDMGNSLVRLGVSKQKIYSGAVAAGQEDGASFKLHRPVGNERLKLEDKS